MHGACSMVDQCFKMVKFGNNISSDFNNPYPLSCYLWVKNGTHYLKRISYFYKVYHFIVLSKYVKQGYV